MTAPTYPDIAAFLTAQLDRLAKAAKRDADGEWHVSPDLWWGEATLVLPGQFNISMRPYAVSHIAQHDPAFVLADIASKRAVVKMWTDAEDAYAKTRTGCREDVANALTFVVIALAAPFADQPGYRPEWAVEA